MAFRFRFTAGFLVVGVAIFAIAAVVIMRTARSNEESNLVEDISAQSNQNADVLAGVVTAYTSGDAGENLVGAPADSAASIGFESLVMSTLLSSSNIVQLSLFDAEGSLLWTSLADPAARNTPASPIFAGALNGQVVTGLTRNINYVTADGKLAQGDLTSTYIPLVDESNASTSQVLEVSREVTSALDFRVENARSSMMRTLFSTLGASFVVLFGIVVVADTIINRSRRKALAQERVAAESQIASEKLELRNQQLQQINREHDKFLSMVSHELRTPLTTMLAFTEVLKRRQDGANKDANLDHLDLMRRSGDRLNSLIEELLEVTQLHAEEFEINKERFSLKEMVTDVEKTSMTVLTPKGQRLRLVVPDQDIELLADRRRVNQMLTNLLSNASAYSAEHTTVTLKVESTPGLVKFSVADQGEGISEEDQKRLFDQFYRGNSEFTRAQSGLGLGLPIVKAIVDAHGGKISVRSQPGAGTDVTVLMPTTANDEQAVSNEDATSEAA